jgi:virginiamycin B lyase
MITPCRRMSAATLVVIVGLMVGAFGEPGSASAVAIRQLPLSAASSPATFVFSWPGGVALSGTKVGSTSALYETISLTPFKLTPGPPGIEVAASAVAPTGVTWLLAYAAFRIGSTTYYEPDLYEMTASGAVLRFRLPVESYLLLDLPSSFAFGADGTIWLARPDGIERYPPGGTPKLYQAAGNPTQIVAGPGNTFYFTQPETDQVGRITITGEIIEYPSAEANVFSRFIHGPVGLAVGPEGDLYITESFPGAIGRLTPSGTLSELAIQPPPPGSSGSPRLDSVVSYPRSIVAGGEGDMWFTDPGYEAVGRVTPTGEVTEYRIPPLAGTAAKEPEEPTPTALTSIPGGLLFAEGNAKAIGLIEPNGQPASEPQVPAKSSRRAKRAVRHSTRCRRSRSRKVRGHTRTSCAAASLTHKQ